MYQTYLVVGETSRSWLLATKGSEWMVESYRKDPDHYGKQLTKLAKKGQRPNFVGHEGDDLWALGTAEDVKLNRWATEHRYKVKEKLDWTDDAIILAIAKLVGYTPLVEG